VTVAAPPGRSGERTSDLVLTLLGPDRPGIMVQVSLADSGDAR